MPLLRTARNGRNLSVVEFRAMCAPCADVVMSAVEGARVVRFREGISRLLNRMSMVGKSSPGRAVPVAGMPRDPEHREQLRRDASGHGGILSEQFAKTLDAADRGLPFPDSSAGPLAYLGNIEPLGLTEQEKDVVREWTRELIEERGEKAVWNSRLRLKLELRYLISEGGLLKMAGWRDVGGRR